LNRAKLLSWPPGADLSRRHSDITPQRPIPSSARGMGSRRHGRRDAKRAAQSLDHRRPPIRRAWAPEFKPSSRTLFNGVRPFSPPPTAASGSRRAPRAQNTRRPVRGDPLSPPPDIVAAQIRGALETSPSAARSSKIGTLGGVEIANVLAEHSPDLLKSNSLRGKGGAGPFSSGRSWAPIFWRCRSQERPSREQALRGPIEAFLSTNPS